MAGATPSRDAVVALAGGPGQAALPLATFIATAIAPALSSRDLLVFDQRGTGKSDPLSCHALANATASEENSSASELVERCARELGPARADFTTSESVADIEALRIAGGYEKLVLYGTSYGTKVALDYAERYPQNVEALVLDSTETPTGPEAFHVSTFKAMTPALRELCSHGACDGVTSNPVADLAHLDSRLGTRPLTGVAYDQQGRPVKLSLTRGDVYQLLLAGDLNPALRAEMPAAVHSALANDPGPLLRLAVLSGVAPSGGGEENSEVDLTLFVDTSCEETPFPWQRAAPEATRIVEAETALNALPGSDFYPFDPEVGLLGQTIPLCLSWPDASPAPPPEAALPDVPTLILSGGQDLRTPTENARSVARLIPDAQVLTVPYTGHSVVGADFTGCAKSALETFFANAHVAPCPATANPFPPAPLAPRSLAAVHPARGVGGTSGRTLAATVETIADLRRSIVVLGHQLRRHSDRRTFRRPARRHHQGDQDRGGAQSPLLRPGSAAQRRDLNQSAAQGQGLDRKPHDRRHGRRAGPSADQLGWPRRRGARRTALRGHRLPESEERAGRTRGPRAGMAGRPDLASDPGPGPYRLTNAMGTR